MKCFYCHNKEGQDHKDDCVTLKQRVRLRVELEYEVLVPASWDKEMIEFHRNDGTWCADNIVTDLQRYVKRAEKKELGCLCRDAKFTFLKVVDAGPLKGGEDNDNDE